MFIYTIIWMSLIKIMLTLRATTKTKQTNEVERGNKIEFNVFVPYAAKVVYITTTLPSSLDDITTTYWTLKAEFMNDKKEIAQKDILIPFSHKPHLFIREWLVNNLLPSGARSGSTNVERARTKLTPILKAAWYKQFKQLPKETQKLWRNLSCMGIRPLYPINDNEELRHIASTHQLENRAQQMLKLQLECVAEFKKAYRDMYGEGRQSGYRELCRQVLIKSWRNLPVDYVCPKYQEALEKVVKWVPKRSMFSPELARLMFEAFTDESSHYMRWEKATEVAQNIGMAKTMLQAIAIARLGLMYHSNQNYFMMISRRACGPWGMSMFNRGEIVTMDAENETLMTKENFRKKLVRVILSDNWKPLRRAVVANRLQASFNRKDRTFNSHILDFIMDGRAIFMRDVTGNARPLTKTMSLVKAFEVAAWNHRVAPPVSASYFDEPETEMPSYGLEEKDKVEKYRIRTSTEMVQAGRECHHCLGSYRDRIGYLYFKKGKVCAQVEPKSWSVVQCFDTHDKTTVASKAFAKWLKGNKPQRWDQRVLVELATNRPTKIELYDDMF